MLIVHNSGVISNMKVCCGFRHRDVFENISDELYNAIIYTAEKAVRFFKQEQ